MTSRSKISRVPIWRIVVPISLVALAIFAVGGPVLAQTFIEPTSLLGGPTAAPLNSSATTQRKIGSLIIGNSGGSSKLCLNSDLINDPIYCISAWSDLGSLTGNYVKLNPTDIWVGGVPGVAAQNGYARVKANATNNQLYTVIAEAPNLPNSAAVYATDGGNGTSYAAYFNGRVYVGDGSGTSSKELCLNGTAALGPATGGKGCITLWSQVSNQLSGNFVLLQTAPGPTTVQVGGEAITGAGEFGTNPATNGGVVLGVPANGTSLCWSCGDGICNSPAETGGAGGNCRIGFPVTGCLNVPNPPGGDC